MFVIRETTILCMFLHTPTLRPLNKALYFLLVAFSCPSSLFVPCGSISLLIIIHDQSSNRPSDDVASDVINSEINHEVVVLAIG